MRIIRYAYDESVYTKEPEFVLETRCINNSLADGDLAIIAIKDDGKVQKVFVDGVMFVPVHGEME